MLDHLMRRPTDLPLKNGGSVRLKPLSLRHMTGVLAEPDSMRRMAMAVQLAVVDLDGNPVMGPDQIDRIMDDFDQRKLTEIGLWLINGPEGGDEDPLSDSLAPTPTDAE